MTPRGPDGLRRSAADLRPAAAQWADTLGPERVTALEDDLRTIASANWFRLDVPGWFGG